MLKARSEMLEPAMDIRCFAVDTNLAAVQVVVRNVRVEAIEELPMLEHAFVAPAEAAIPGR